MTLGLVVFFPSYSYKDQVIKYLKDSQQFSRLIMHKQNIFEEKANSTDDLLENYKRAIKEKKQGSILFSVVGGKLSEATGIPLRLPNIKPTKRRLTFKNTSGL